jgi:hypothetical protein
MAWLYGVYKNVSQTLGSQIFKVHVPKLSILMSREIQIPITTRVAD